MMKTFELPVDNSNIRNSKKKYKNLFVLSLSKLEYILRAMIGFGMAADSPTNKYAPGAQNSGAQHSGA